MPEIWFRGEGAGVLPGKPGGNLHDLGDGLYLTDTEDVAWQYARIRGNAAPENYRIFTVPIERNSLGNVLDLTNDARWMRFMGEPIHPRLTMNRLTIIRGQHELYGQYFNEFLGKYNINIKTYNAVVGPEYVRGGKQLCILSNSGLGARLQARVLALLRPEPWAARLYKVTGQKGPYRPAAWYSTEESAGAPTKLTRTLRGAKAVGQGIILAALPLLIAYLQQALVNKYHNEPELRKGMARLQSEIDRYVNARIPMLLDALGSSGVAYLTTAIEVKYQQSFNPTMPHGGVETAWVLTHVLLDSIYIGSTNQNGTKRKDDFDLGHTFTQTTSSPLTAPQEDVDDYRDRIKQLDWYDETLRNPNLLPSDVEKLHEEKETLRKTVDFGDFQPDRTLWTSDGYANMTGAAVKR